MVLGGLAVAVLAATAIALAPDEVSRWESGFARAATLVAPGDVSAGALASARATYRERCQPCHGALGRGDGPVAAALDIKPADLVLHVPQHTDGELFYFISEGVPRTPMPPWRDVLDDDERWALVQYLRALADRRP